MSERVTMPALGESVTEGTVTRWLKNVGDSVAVDEPLLEVSTDKVDTEIPSPVAGTLQEILVAEDETVPVGTDLAVIGDATSAPVAPPAPAGGRTGCRTGRPPARLAQPTADRQPAGTGRRTGPAAPAAQEEAPQPARSQAPAAAAPAEAPAAPAGGQPPVHHRHDAGSGRVGDRGHGHPLAQGRG